MNKYTAVSGCEKGSIAEEIGICKGDRLIKINGCEISDILEYRFLCADTEITLEIEKSDGTTEEIEIEKDEYENLGIEFEYPLMSKPKACCNKCIFCFIDQLPEGMRKTLYFKDDDSRLSFLQGNYVTLTNLSRREIENIARMRISPVNVSVHTTDPELRVAMMRNKTAGDVYEIMQYWANAGIIMNCQVVLCRGINDKKQLDKTIEDLSRLHPSVGSLSVVPVGISDHREGLFELEAFDKESSAEVIEQINKWQKKLLEKCGTRFVYAADEFYLKAGIEIPPYEEYEDFPQIENGVGLIASMQDEFDMAIGEAQQSDIHRKCSIATGVAAYDFIRGLVDKITEKFKNIEINVHRIENTVFGKNITVAGLICGCDIIKSLEGKDLGDTLYIPLSMLRDGENVFLDDITTDELSKRLGVKVEAIENDGFEFVDRITGEGE